MVLSGALIIVLAGGVTAGDASAAPGQNADKARVIEYWTPARRAAASPRDLVIDQRGLGYLRRADGSLKPHGHQISAEAGGGKTRRRDRAVAVTIRRRR